MSEFESRGLEVYESKSQHMLLRIEVLLQMEYLLLAL